MSKPLKQRLADQYGAGAYLTNASVDWSDPIIFEPETSYCPDLAREFTRAANLMHIDGLIDENIFSFGQGCKPLWHAQPQDLKVGSEYDGVFLFGLILKQQGSKEFRIPRVLAPLVPEFKRQAAHQFAVSQHAVDKLAGISLRSLPLAEGVRQISEGSWHVHHPFSAEQIDMGYQLYDITADQLAAMRQVSRRLVQSEYYLSNICSTMIQTAPFESAANVRNTRNVRIVSETPTHKQLGDCEVAMGNGYVYHMAATVPPELVGQRRTFVLTSFMPSIAMERHFAQ